MKFASAEHLKGVRTVGFLDFHRNVGFDFLKKSRAEVTGSYVLALFARKRTVVNHKIHRNGGFVDRDEGKLFHTVLRADRFAYVDVFDARNGDYVAHFRA